MSAAEQGWKHGIIEAARLRTELDEVRRAVIAAGDAGYTAGRQRAAEDLTVHGPDALPHGYDPDECGDECDNRACPVGATHNRCTPQCKRILNLAHCLAHWETYCSRYSAAVQAAYERA